MKKFKLAGILILVVLLVFTAGCGGEPEITPDNDAKTPEPADSDVQPIESEEVEPVITGIVYSDDGDVHITESGMILSDTIVEKDLYIDETVGDGDFTLQNVEVKGTIYVNGGGKNSGYLIDVVGSEMIVSSKDGTRVVCRNTTMEGVHLVTDCIVETDSNGLKKVTVGSKAQSAIDVLMKGEYPEVTIESAANVTISGTVSLLSVLEGAGMTSIDMVDDSRVYFYACNGQSVTVTGGAIIEAWINAEYCALPEDTSVIGTKMGVANVKVGEVSYDIPDWPTPEVEVPQEDASTVSIFADGYPRISRSGTTVTIVVILNVEGDVYAIVEGSEIPLAHMSPEEIIQPGIYIDNPNYIPIYGSVSADTVGEVYTFTIENSNIDTKGVAIFVIAVDADGNYSPIYRVVD